jgi:O-antigen/teichoic acid export membrane protein
MTAVPTANAAGENGRDPRRPAGGHRPASPPKPGRHRDHSAAAPVVRMTAVPTANAAGENGRDPRRPAGGHSPASPPKPGRHRKHSAAAPAEAHLRGSVLLLLGRVLSLAATVAAQIVMVHYLSKTDFGAFAYGLALFALLQQFLPLGLNNSDTRFLALYDERDDFPRLLGVIWVEIATIMSLGTIVVIVLAALQGPLIGEAVPAGAARSAVLVLVILAPISALDDEVVNVFAVFARPGAVFVRRYVLEPGLRLAVVAVVALGGFGITTLAVGYVLAGAAGLALYAVLLVRLLRTVRAAHRATSWRFRAPVRELAKFALPLATANLVQAVIVSLPIMCLAYFRPLSDVAEVKAVQPVAALNLVVSLAFLTLFTPAAARAVARSDSKAFRDLHWRTAAWIAVLTFPVLVMTTVFAPPVTRAAFGARYSDAWPYMAAMAGAYFVQAATGYNGISLQIAGRVRFVLGASVGGLLVAVVANVVLVPLFGTWGAVAAMVTAMLAHNMLKQWGLHRFGIGAWNRTYAPVFRDVLLLGLAAVGAAIILGRSVGVGVAVVVLMTLVLLRRSAATLMIGETFPELARVPLMARLLGVKAQSDGNASTSAQVQTPGEGSRLIEPVGGALDCFFLLPEPLAPNDVIAVDADVPRSLTQALTSAGHGIVCIRRAEPAQVVLLRNPSLDELRLVRDRYPRAVVQVHVTRAAGGFRPLARCTRRLRTAGFDPLSISWAIPTIEQARKFVPLEHGGALRVAIDRQCAAFRPTLRSLAIEAMVRSQAVGVLAREGVVVARVVGGRRP